MMGNHKTYIGKGGFASEKSMDHETKKRTDGCLYGGVDGAGGFGRVGG